MATAPPNAIIRPDRPVFYPERDGKLMGETPVHREAMVDLIADLQDYFAADRQVYISGNMFLYFVEGDPRRNVSPDVMVVRGVDRDRYRATYRTWEDDGHAPDFVIEVSSRSTRREDLGEKFAPYRDVLKVREYLLFDPFGEYLKPNLQGFRLVGARYEPIPLVDGRLGSDVLGLQFGVLGQSLRLFDAPTGRLRLNRQERLREADAIVQTTTATNRALATRVERAEERADRAEVRADRAEEQNRVLATRVDRAEVRADRAEVRAERAEEQNRVLVTRVERAEERADRAEESSRTLAERVAESDRRAQQSFDLLRQELDRLRADRRPD